MIAPGQFPKRCTCCGLLYTAEQWAALPFPNRSPDGVYRSEGVATLEMRDCVCGSTLAVELVPVVEVTVPEIASWLP